MTRSAFVAEANSLCRAEQKKGAQIPQPTTAEGFVRSVRTQIADVKALLDALSRLRPPPDLQTDMERWLDQGKRQVVALEDGLPAAEKASRSGDLSATERAYEPAIREYARISIEDPSLDRRLGFSICTD